MFHITSCYMKIALFCYGSRRTHIMSFIPLIFPAIAMSCFHWNFKENHVFLLSFPRPSHSLSFSPLLSLHVNSTPSFFCPPLPLSPPQPSPIIFHLCILLYSFHAFHFLVHSIGFFFSLFIPLFAIFLKLAATHSPPPSLSSPVKG